MSEAIIVVTGATGRIGRQLVPKLLDQGNTVVALGRNLNVLKTFTQNSTGTLKTYPIRDLAELTEREDIFRGASCVLHLAAANNDSAESKTDFSSANIDGAVSVFESCRRFNVKSMINVSSLHVKYSESVGAKSTEYVKSKRVAEETLREFALDGAPNMDGPQVITLRLAPVYGEILSGNLFLLEKLVRFQLPLPLGSATGRRSYLGIVNLHSAISKIQTSVSEESSEKYLSFDLADKAPLILQDILRCICVRAIKEPRIFPFPISILAFLLILVGKRTIANMLTSDLIADISPFCERYEWRPASTQSLFTSSRQI